MNRRLAAAGLLAFVAAALSTPPVLAQAAAPPPELRVLTKQAEPFAMRTADGGWTGISIELWEEVARELGLRYRYEEAELETMLDAVAAGEADVAVAALTITGDREARMDFTHAFHSSGIGIAVPAESGAMWLGLLAAIFSSGFLKAAGGLLLVLGVIGVLVWLFERRHNEEEFGGGTLRGLGSGLWWSAVTMTTVGYGDKAPRTLLGRGVGLVWMFASIILISGFTAAIASSLTVEGLASRIRGPDDLPGARVGTVAGSTSAVWLERRNIVHDTYPTALDAARALAADDLDAVVYDEPMLRWLSAGTLAGAIDVLAAHVQRQDYAFALPTGSDLREPLNREILRQLTDARWRELLERYLGH